MKLKKLLQIYNFEVPDQKVRVYFGNENSAITNRYVEFSAYDRLETPAMELFLQCFNNGFLEREVDCIYVFESEDYPDSALSVQLMED